MIIIVCSEVSWPFYKATVNWNFRHSPNPSRCAPKARKRKVFFFTSFTRLVHSSSLKGGPLKVRSELVAAFCLHH